MKKPALLLIVLLAMTAPASAAFLGGNSRLGAEFPDAGSRHVAGELSREGLPDSGGTWLRRAAECFVAPSKVPTAELNPTHRLKVRYGSAKAQYEALKADIRANGIKEPIKYVEHGGKKYIVDGHHRLRAAQELGIKNVPAQRVELPYGGYRTPDDLLDFFNNPG